MGTHSALSSSYCSCCCVSFFGLAVVVSDSNIICSKSNVEESSVLVAALFAVLTELPNKTDCAGIHYQCLQLFQQCLSTANVKVRMLYIPHSIHSLSTQLQTTVLQGLKNLLNDTAAETIRKKVSLQYLQGLGMHLSILAVYLIINRTAHCIITAPTQQTHWTDISRRCCVVQ